MFKSLIQRITGCFSSINRIIFHNHVFENYGKLWPYVKRYWFRALIAMILCIPIGSIDAAIAFVLKPYMDSVLLASKAQTFSWMIPIVVISFTIMQGVLNYFATYLNTWVGSHVTNDLKLQLFQKMLTLDSAFFDHSSSGDILTRFNNDPDAACGAQLDRIKTFTKTCISTVSLIAVLFYNSYQLALISVVALGCAFLPLANIRKKIVDAMNGVLASGSSILRVYNETFTGNKIIASYNLNTQQTSRFKSILDQIFKLQIKLVQRTSWLSPIMHVIISVGIGMTVGYGSYLITSSQITPGNFVSFITALLMLYNPVKNIGSDYNDMQRSFFAIERVFEILKIEPHVKDRPDAIALTGPIKSLTFNHVDFCYPKSDRLVLQDFSLDIPINKVTALVGNSGGGKSTIVNLIPRFYDVAGGSIAINGRDIREYTLASLRDQIVIVFQENFLFAGTIRENILCGNSNATEDEIWNAVKLSYLEDFVKSLPQGLDSYIGERGLLLSGGQKQRVAIARAFVKDAPIVILDEATSALDNEAEKVVQQAIYNLMLNRTVIVVAHRLSTIIDADKILVINNGKLVETGNHQQLIGNKDGYYAKLYKSQFSKVV